MLIILRNVRFFNCKMFFIQVRYENPAKLYTNCIVINLVSLISTISKYETFDWLNY